MNTAQEVANLLKENGWGVDVIDEFDIPDSLKKKVKDLILPSGVRPQRSRAKLDHDVLNFEQKKAVLLGVDPIYATLDPLATPNKTEDCADIRFDWYQWFPRYGYRTRRDTPGAEAQLSNYFEGQSEWICYGCKETKPKIRAFWYVQRGHIPVCLGCAKRGLKAGSLAEIDRLAVEQMKKTPGRLALQRLYIKCGKPPRCPACSKFVAIGQGKPGKRWVIKKGFTPVCRSCWNKGRRYKCLS
jgi:hypothetical protein